MLIEGLRRHSFVVRYLTLFGGEVLSKLAVILAFARLARVLGPREFGVVELALSITVFFVLGAESGLGSYGARIVETTPERASQFVPRVVVLRAMLGIPAYVVILTLSARYGAPGMGILAIYGLMVLLTPFFTQWVFQGLRQMQWVAAGSLLRYGVFATLTMLFVRRSADIRMVAVAEVCGALALATFNTVLIRQVLRLRLDWRGAWRGARALLKETWFLGASDLTWATMWYAPTIILGWSDLGRTEHVAWLAAAVRVVMSAHTLVWLYFFNLVPNLSKELHHGVQEWRALIHRSLSVSMWAAGFVVLGGTLFAPLIVRMLYGAAFGRAVLPFQIVVWMIPVAWLSGHFRFSLIVSGHQKLEFLASAIAGITTVVAASVAASAYGAPGAAAALLAGGVVNAIAAAAATYTVIGSVRLTAAVAPALACLTAIAVGSVAGWVIGPVIGAAVASVLYAALAASQWDAARLKLAWEGRLN